MCGHYTYAWILVGGQVISALGKWDFQRLALPCPVAARAKACTWGLPVGCPFPGLDSGAHRKREQGTQASGRGSADSSVLCRVWPWSSIQHESWHSLQVLFRPDFDHPWSCLFRLPWLLPIFLPDSSAFLVILSIHFSSVAQSCPTLCDPLDCSTPGFPVLHQLPELTQTHVHRVGDAIQPFHPLSSTSPPAFNLSQHQGLFQWVSSSHQVAKVSEFQLQHQSFQWIFRTDFL